MNPLHRFAIVSSITALLTVSVIAQSTNPLTGSTLPTPENLEKEKTDLYKRFLETYKDQQASAFKTASDYLERFSTDETPQSRYMKKFVRRYERAMRQWHVAKLVDERNFAEAFNFGSEMLKSEPNDFDTLYTLVQGGVLAFTNGNKSHGVDAADYAKRALKLIESDASVEKREEKLGLLYMSLGIFYLTSDNAQARIYLTRFSELETVKTDPRMYGRVADAIIGAEFYPLQNEFNSRFPTPQQKMSTQAEAIRLRLYLVVDFIIDALARAVALAGANPRFRHLTADWLDRLVTFYKYRNSGFVTGLPEFVLGTLHVPFPRPPDYYF
jgi:hypothetical protein